MRHNNAIHDSDLAPSSLVYPNGPVVRLNDTTQFTRIVVRLACLQLAPIALSMIYSKNTHCLLKSFILYIQNKKALK